MLYWYLYCIIVFMVFDHILYPSLLCRGQETLPRWPGERESRPLSAALFWESCVPSWWVDSQCNYALCGTLHMTGPLQSVSLPLQHCIVFNAWKNTTFFYCEPLWLCCLTRKDSVFALLFHRFFKFFPHLIIKLI